MPKTNENQSFQTPENQVSSRQVSSRLSFREAVEKVRDQIDVRSFHVTERDLAKEILNNIAEVYLLRDETQIRIAGEMLEAYVVKEVFEQLGAEHVQLVIENFKKVSHIVNYKRGYIRTALYNSVFEIEAHYLNQVKSGE